MLWYRSPVSAALAAESARKGAITVDFGSPAGFFLVSENVLSDLPVEEK